MSVISLAISYLTDEADETPAGPAGRTARYARGDDYHTVLKERLGQFVEGLPELVGREVKTRIFVDDGPMNDRAAAERAGVGWFGKNTNILTQSHGSWVFLRQVVTDLRERFRNSAVKRAKRVGLQGNACVALGNIGDSLAVPALGTALNTAEPLVRMHAAWALGRIGGAQAEDALRSALTGPTDPEVLNEIEAALDDLKATAPAAG